MGWTEYLSPSKSNWRVCFGNFASQYVCGLLCLKNNFDLTTIARTACFPDRRAEHSSFFSPPLVWDQPFFMDLNYYLSNVELLMPFVPSYLFPFTDAQTELRYLYFYFRQLLSAHYNFKGFPSFAIILSFQLCHHSLRDFDLYPLSDTRFLLTLLLRTRERKLR